MTLDEGKEKFIQAWGTMATSWGVNRTMAQIHALLLVSPEPLNADQVMEALKISRGNANMNLRALIDWGLVHKELKTGERKEYFRAEKDIWEVVRRIIVERKKRELEPMIRAMEEVSAVQGAGPEVEEFRKVVEDIRQLSTKADQVLERLVQTDPNWILTAFLRLIR